MKIVKVLLIASGGLVSLGSIGFWYFLNALACGMNTTGCRELHVKWFSLDGETITLFYLPLLVGVLMVIGGIRMDRGDRASAASRE